MTTVMLMLAIYKATSLLIFMTAMIDIYHDGASDDGNEKQNNKKVGDKAYENAVHSGDMEMRLVFSVCLKGPLIYMTYANHKF